VHCHLLSVPSPNRLCRKNRHFIAYKSLLFTYYKRIDFKAKECSSRSPKEYIRKSGDKVAGGEEVESKELTM
jgi:hypothetical protein